MVNNFNIVITIAFLSTLMACNNSEPRDLKGMSEKPIAVEPKQSLANIMLCIQQRHIKLYYAGVNQNWELAKFESHELEESFEYVSENHPSHDDIDLKTLINNILQPKLEALKKSIDKKDTVFFHSAYSNFTNGCNSCHSATKHSFIKITEPTLNTFSNQLFKQN